MIIRIYRFSGFTMQRLQHDVALLAYAHWDIPPPPPIVVKRDKACLVFTEKSDIYEGKAGALPFLFFADFHCFIEER
jgi:hypothetical protein